MKKWIPSIVVMVGIFYMSSRTGTELNHIFPFFKDLNWGHLVAYFGLSLTYMWALTQITSIKKAMIYAVLFSVLYGVTDEWHQVYVPGRTPDIHDLVNDTIGATAGALLFFYWMRKEKQVE